MLERGRGGQTGLYFPVVNGKRPPKSRSQSISGFGFYTGRLLCARDCVDGLLLSWCSDKACPVETSTGKQTDGRADSRPPRSAIRQSGNERG